MKTIQSDGATIPFWKRGKWKRKYGLKAIQGLDKAGYGHDARKASGMNCVKARRMMMIDMINYSVPQEIIEWVIYWLGVYDSLPRIIRWSLNRIGRGKLKKVEVEI